MGIWGHIYNLFRDNKNFPATYYVCIGCNRRYRYVSRDDCIVSDGVGICPQCMNSLLLTPPGGTFEGSEHVAYLFSATFYQGIIKEAIHRYKFQGMRRYSVLFSHLILENLKPVDLSTFDFVTAVPLSKERIHERGFNQSTLLARPVAETYHLPFRPEAIKRIRDTRPQSSLDGTHRRTNVQGAFEAHDVAGKRILLVDDIFTTGHTMDSCAAALHDAGAVQVAGIVLSKVHTQKNRLP